MAKRENLTQSVTHYLHAGTSYYAPQVGQSLQRHTCATMSSQIFCVISVYFIHSHSYFCVTGGAEFAASQLDGVFFFVVLDLTEGEISVARDTYGVKPGFR